MSDTKNFTEMLQGELFLFTVGPEKAKFIMHASLVYNTSKIMETMFNCGMRETVERVCKLPDVSTEVFESFAAYVYRGDYPEIAEPVTAGSSDKGTVDEGAISEKPIGTNQKNHSSCSTCAPDFNLISENMMRDGLSWYQCRKCRINTQPDTTRNFPFCGNSACQSSMKEPKLYCVVVDCKKVATTAKSTLCARHFLKYSTPYVQAFGIQSLPAKIQDLPRFRFRSVPAVDSLLDALQTKNNAALPSVHQLMHHARVAVFAEMYEVLGLQELAITRLYGGLVHLSDVAQEETNLLELIKFIYANTRDNGEGMQYHTRHILRRLICEFINFHTATFLESNEFQFLLLEGGELPIDILLARE